MSKPKPAAFSAERLCAVCLAGLLALAAVARDSSAASLPRAAGFVSDYAGVMDARSRDGLNRLLGELQRQTGAEIAVLTVKSLDGGDIQRFANELFSAWGIGKKGKDNGVLVVVALEERKWQIEVGYGLEGALPDGLCGEIGRERMVPHFKRGDYSRGIVGGALAVAEVVARESGTTLEKVSDAASVQGQGYGGAPPRRGFSLWRLLFFIILIPIAIRNPWILLLFMGGGFGRRGGWSGGGFGGGFGGFGGGMSGGGGAGGGW